jgi:hypothetical protein
MAGGQILQIAEHDLGTGRCELQLDGELDLWSVERLQLEGEGGRLVLCGCSDQVLRIFTVAGLTEAGIVFADRGEVLAELAMVE